MDNATNIQSEEQTGRLQQPAVGSSASIWPYYWSTEAYHHDNTFTMSEYMKHRLPERFTVIEVDGSMAVVQDYDGTCYELHASGNGDSFNHKVEAKVIL